MTLDSAVALDRSAAAALPGPRLPELPPPPEPLADDAEDSAAPETA
ncbi:MAG: hypothetical protein L0323_09315 [Planctomycetes bacterium]|nr:hypothetical protein [Planctomycetota bacterium]